MLMTSESIRQIPENRHGMNFEKKRKISNDAKTNALVKKTVPRRNRRPV